MPPLTVVVTEYVLKHVKLSSQRLNGRQSSMPNRQSDPTITLSPADSGERAIRQSLQPSIGTNVLSEAKVHLQHGHIIFCTRNPYARAGASHTLACNPWFLYQENLTPTVWGTNDLSSYFMHLDGYILEILDWLIFKEKRSTVVLFSLQPLTCRKCNQTLKRQCNYCFKHLTQHESYQNFAHTLAYLPNLHG